MEECEQPINNMTTTVHYLAASHHVPSKGNSLKNQLHLLAQEKDYEVSSDELCKYIRDLVLCGDCEMSVKDERGKSVLQTAISYSNIFMIPILIELGADVNTRDNMLRTPLHDAVLLNETESVVHLLLLKGAKVSAEDQTSETPLHLAVSKNNVTVVQLLLENGASVTCRNKHQQTPLHRALLKKKLAADVVELLLSNGADANAQDHMGETALHLAVSHQDVAIVRSLLQHGASVNCKDGFQQTPLHRALLAKNINADMVELLLTSGVTVDAKDYKGETPLHLAVSKNDLLVVKSLVDCGASVECRDKYRYTPLHRAVVDKAVEIVEFLLESGANANAKSHEGNRPLHHICKQWTSDCRCDRIMKMLSEKGADVNARNDRGETAIFCALSLRNYELVKELLKYSADLNERKVRELVLSDHRATTDEIQPFLFEYLVKLSAVNFPVARMYITQISRFGHYNGKYRKECLKEVEKLKSTNIYKDKSLYDFLHARVKRRAVYSSSETLQQLINSPRLRQLFPNYCVMIMAKYHEVTARKSLLKLAEGALYGMIQIRLADSVDKIVAYLDNEDLISVIQANFDDDANDDELRNEWKS